MEDKKQHSQRALLIRKFLLLSCVAGFLATTLFSPVTILTAKAGDSAFSLFGNLPQYLAQKPLSQRTTLYATSGGQPVPIAYFYDQNRVLATWDQIPDTVKNAALAAEDPRFYTHSGIDITGTVRGILSTLLGGTVQGGSTITQQYVKNVLVQRCEENAPDPFADEATQAEQTKAYEACYNLATEVSAARKIREMRYAVELEKTVPKDDIFLNYLNISLFGGRIYGIEAAAEYYFGIPVNKLNLSQSATLIAILNNPDNLRIDHPDDIENGAINGYAKTKERRDYILSQMQKRNMMSQDEYNASLHEPITTQITPLESGCMQAQSRNAGFFCDYVTRIIERDPVFGNDAETRDKFLMRSGASIYTTLNLDLQNTTQSALSSYIPPTSPNLNLGASHVSVEVATGRVITMIQNKPYDNSGSPSPESTAINFNTDYQDGGSTGFQTGSTYKMFDLLEWFTEGKKAYQSVSGSQMVYPQNAFHSSDPCNDIGGSTWHVSNDEGGAVPSATVIQAAAESINSVFAKMATQLDLCGIKQRAQNLLVHGAAESINPFLANPSSVLGTNYISPLTMATAYAGVANHGVARTPIAIDRIVMPDQKEHPVPASVTSPNPINPDVAAATIYTLQSVLAPGGTSVSANPQDGIPIFGKSGTTDNSVSNWLVTSTTRIAQAVWVGNVEGQVALRSQSFNGYRGGAVKFAISKPILTALNQAYGGENFQAPPASMLR